MRSFHKLFFAFAILLYTSCAEEISTDTGAGSPVQDSTLIVRAQDTTKETRNDITAQASLPIDTNAPLLQNWQKNLRDRGINFSLKNFYAATMRTLNVDDCHPWDGDMDDAA